MPKKTSHDWEYDYVIDEARLKGIVGLNRSTLREIAVGEYVKANTAKNGVVDVTTIAKPLIATRAAKKISRLKEALKDLEEEAEELGVD